MKIYVRVPTTLLFILSLRGGKVLILMGQKVTTLPFRWTQVKKKGPLQTPKPLIFFLFPISENVDVEILQRGNFEKKLFLRFVMGLFSPGPEVFSRYL